MKIAVLDLGTNTFHLLIAEVHRDKTFKILLKTRAVVKLGKGGIGENRIDDKPFQGGIRAIQNFNEQIKKFNVDKIFSFATSAIRSSVNGNEFVKNVNKLTGIKIRTLSGNEEAELIYYGVRQSVKLNTSPVLIMDIGGGSTEFVIASENKIFWKHSFNIGVARLLEKFNPSDPIQGSEVSRIKKYLEEILMPLQSAMNKYHISKLIGCSGSFDTLAEMIAYRFHGRNILRAKSFYQFDLTEYQRVHDWLIKSNTTMRKKTKGLIKMRADMIVTSSICTNYILKKFKIKEMILSKYALKEGALWAIINKRIS